MTGSEEHSLVVLTCGIAGAGKTTYAQRLESEGYVRLSIDEEIWRQFGRYDVDYPAERYPELQRQAEQMLRRALVDLVRQGRNIVVDISLWRRSSRDEYKTIVEEAGGHWRLVYLRAAPELLRRRLAARESRRDANAAFPITKDILELYLRDFEEPHDEDEEIIDVRP
jgi:predicted kinase